MKANLKLTVAAMALATALASGCAGSRPSVQERYTEYSDPCWPERYNASARKAVLDTHGAQIANGYDVDTTLMNYHFESGSEELNQAGRAKLDYLLRRRPTVDGKLNLQTARDLAYDEKAPAALPAKRSDLDAKRINSIQQYVSASTSGRNVGVDVTIKDPADMQMDAMGPANSVRGLSMLFSSTITGAAGAGAVAGAGGAGAPTSATAAGAGATGAGGPPR
jgi:hypothetical protein